MTSKHKNIYQILYAITFFSSCILLYIACDGGFIGTKWTSLGSILASSLIASFLSVIFLSVFEKKQDIDFSELKNIIHNELIGLNNLHFVRIDRNKDLKDEYWVNLIGEMNSTIQPVWFIGTRLSLWLTASKFRLPLQEKCLSRLKLIRQEYDKTKNKKSFIEDDNYTINVFLTNPDYFTKWEKFFKKIVDSLCKDNPKRKEELSELFWNKIKIKLVSVESVQYSMVLCGSRLAITSYNGTGRTEDSPTFEIAVNSPIRKLYLDDVFAMREDEG